MYKKILTLGLAFAMSFVFAGNSLAVEAVTQPSAVAGTGIVTVAINPLVVNADANNPTGVSGQASVKIASFDLIALKSRRGVAVNKIVLKNNFDKNLALAKDFQNLTLRHNGAQIAPTIAVLSSWANAKYVFIPSTAINILPGQTYTVDVYADSSSNAVNVNRVYSAVSLDKLMGINLFTNTNIGWGTQYNRSGEVDVIGQNIYIADKGSLTVGMASSTTVAQNLVMGTVGQTLAIFDLSAGPAEDVMIDKIVITDVITNASSASGSIVNLQIFSDGMQFGNTVSGMFPGSGSATATFSGINLGIPKNQTRQVVLRGDVNIYPEAVSGSAHKFGILSANDISAVGMSSAKLISTNNTPAVGNDQFLYRSKLANIAKVPGFSNGGHPSFGEKIGQYAFINNSSLENYSLTVSDFDLIMATDINNYSASTKSVKVYRDYISSSTKIAEKQFAGDADFSTISNWDTFIPFTIGSVDGYGQTNIIVVADTIDAMATNFITTGISNVVWTDGVTPEIIGLTPGVITTAVGEVIYY